MKNIMENNINNNPQKSTQQNGIGPVVGVIIIILVVVVGGFYFWENKIIKNNQSSEIVDQAKDDFSAVDLTGLDANETESTIQDGELDKLNEGTENL